ncbi:MAG: ATP-dependent Clp protease ATP-binding subunit [Nitrospirae bacterium]|nr:ATP-dependent Clp protease ATP-binding subunit [Nitrospirota bacterium]MBI3352911.1 ATP-dependent Clp protease ATP-binding subunit [Nitrospirota bacterium]
MSNLIPEANIPISITNRAKNPLNHIETTLKEEVIGQDSAIVAILNSLLRASTGFRNADRPIATLFFSGPSGVGKTETVRALAKALHNNPKACIKVDCSEYSEGHTISKLIGSPPGYMGSDLPVVLDKQEIEGRNWNIILFDEIEKGHTSLHNLLLQIMDEGVVTLSRRTKGNDAKVNFSSTLLVMTSNVGSRKVSEVLEDQYIGFKKKENYQALAQMVNQEVQKEIEKHFSPEFRNRVSEFVIFHPLSEDSLLKVLEKHLNQIGSRCATKGFALHLSDKAKTYLIQKGTNLELGARPLLHLVEKEVEAKIAEYYALGEIQAGDYIVGDLDHSEIVFRRAERVSITVKADFSTLGNNDPPKG